MKKSDEQLRREARERATIQQAHSQQKVITYIDDDGCEVRVSPNGHVFYNIDDWF